MMIQRDTGPMRPNALAQETVEAVRRALQCHVRSTDSDSPELRSALHALAAVAATVSSWLRIQ